MLDVDAQVTISETTVSHENRRLTSAVLQPTKGSQKPPLLVLHGISRDTDALVKYFTPEVIKHRRVVVVPHFDKNHWPIFQRPSATRRPDHALLATLGALAPYLPGFDQKIDIFGFSGGAQLAQHTAMLYPHRFGQVHLASAGWYCLPTSYAPHPYGLGYGDAQPSNLLRCRITMLDSYLAVPITVYVGEHDTAEDSALRTNPELTKHQGKNRLERAQKYVHSVNSVAAARGMTPPAQLVTLPGCTHDFAHCADKGGLATLVSTSHHHLAERKTV